jgi:Tol biopolymer transport system component
MLNRTILSALLGLVAILALPGAAPAAGGHGGAVVFSRVVTTTVKETVRDGDGNPVRDGDGNVVVRETTTVEGGLFAVRDHRLNQLTEDPTDTEPSFSPDSRAIVFSRGGDVFSVRADGSGLRRLTDGPVLDTVPQVAPNGRYVVFERRASEGSPADLYSVSINGGAAKVVAATPDDDADASFSTDGRAIVFVHSVAETDGGAAGDIYSVRPTGRGLARLTRTGRIDEFTPRFFSGGIVYSRGEGDEGSSAYADVYTMRRNGRKVKPLVAGAGSAYVEDVTRDGRTLLFRRDQGLWVKRIGAASARKLTELPDGSQTNGVFSSDGKKVAAFIEADGSEQLTSIDVRSGSTTQFAAGFVPSETTDTGGTTTTIGPVITWQPTRR